MELVYETKSDKTWIRVYEEPGGVRYLRLGKGTEIHSTYDPKQVLIEVLEESYWNYFCILPHLTEVKEVLLLGVAAGTVARQYQEYYPDVHIDGVEIDGDIVRVAKEYMGLNVDNLMVHEADGIEFLENCDKKYDIVILDAFKGGNLNTEFLTIKVFENIKRCLRHNGLFVTNYFEQLSVPYLVKRATSKVFEHMVRIPIPGTYNYIVVASDMEVDMKKPAREIKEPQLRRIARYVAENFVVDR
ncbi:MAG: spermidine synthase [Candidatus Nanoarchaeia archaeon]